MFCHKCGTQIAEGAAFCHRCGTKVPQESPITPDSNTEPENKPSSSMFIITLAKFIGLILVGIIVLALIQSGTLQNIWNDLVDINREIENRATGSVTVPGTQSAGDLFPATSDTTQPRSDESSFAWVEEAHMITEDDVFKARYIVGTIENVSDITFESASVHFILYDSAGNQVDTTMDVVSNFKAGNTWRFKAPVTSDNAAYFEFSHAKKTYPK